MAFKPLKYEKGKPVQMACANSQTIVKGDALADNGSGYLAVATLSTSVDIHYVALQTVTTTTTGQFVLCIETENVLFEADTDAVWSTIDQGDYVPLGSVSTVNPDNTGNEDIFYILKGVGTAESDTKVLGYFTRGIPNV